MDSITVSSHQAQGGQPSEPETVPRNELSQMTTTGALPPPITNQQTSPTNLESQPNSIVTDPIQTNDNNQSTTATSTFVPPEIHPPLNNQAPIIQPLLEADTPTLIASSDLINQTRNLVSNVDSKQESSSQTTPQKTIITKVKLSDELNIFDWFRTTDIINQIAERAKNSVDTVITALDPGMKEYLYSGGNINIMVVSDSNLFVSPIRDAFQSVFGRATVVAARYNPPEAAAEYPVKLALGFNASTVVALERIKKLRLDTSTVPQNQVVVAVQPCIVGLEDDSSRGGRLTSNLLAGADQANKWFVTYNVVIDDPVLSATLNSYSQLIPIDEDVIAKAKETKFAQDFQEAHLGFPKSIDELMTETMNLQSNVSEDYQESKWLRTWSGQSDVQLIRELSITVAHLYRRNRLQGIDD